MHIPGLGDYSDAFPIAEVFLKSLDGNYFILFSSGKYSLIRIDDCISNTIIEEYRNDNSSIIIHEHEFASVMAKGEK
jgi:hypothetical protein